MKYSQIICMDEDFNRLGLIRRKNKTRFQLITIVLKKFPNMKTFKL